MLQIDCPYCQEARQEEEFSYHGEAHIARPLDPEALSDKEWGDYLFFRNNPRGIHHEMWYHAAGCRRYFNVTRNTLSYDILETYYVGTQPASTAPSVSSVGSPVDDSSANSQTNVQTAAVQSSVTQSRAIEADEKGEVQ